MSDGTRTVYGPAERPPLGLLVGSAAQHVGVLTAINIAFPVIVLNALPAGSVDGERFIGLAFLVLGIGTLLQCRGLGPLGSRLLVPTTFTAAYMPPILLAVERGGLPLMAGMLMIAALVELGFGLILRRIRHFVSVELAGVVIVTIGILLGMVGFRLIFSLDPHGAAIDRAAAPGLGGLTVIVMIFAAVYLPGSLKTLAALVGLVVGLIAAPFFGEFDLARLPPWHEIGLIDVPMPFFPVPTFDLALLPGFVIAGLACALRTAGDVTTAQRAATPGWRRPDYRQIARGILSDGVSTLTSAILGSLGTNTFSGSVGLSVAAGVLSRAVGILAGLILIAMSLLPPVRAVALMVPQEISGAVLLFSAAFIVMNGLFVIASRALDNRRILVVGLSLLLVMAHDAYPGFFAGLPPALAALTRSSLTVAIVCAVVMTLVLGLGQRRKRVRAFAAAELPEMTEFVRGATAGLGMARDVAGMMVLAAEEVADLVRREGGGQGLELTVEASDAMAALTAMLPAGVSLEKMPPPKPPSSLDDIEDVDAYMQAVQRRLVLDRADCSEVQDHGGWRRLRIVFDQ